MTTFNGARYLSEQLASIAAQRLRPYEIVVCDDGSQDDTLYVLERFAHAAPFPMRIFRNEARLGFVDNFFRAASLCRGRYIAWCDQDDAWHPKKLLEVSGLLESAYDCGVVVHSSVVANEALDPTRQRLPRIWRTRVCEPLRCDPWLTPPGYAQVFSRELLELVSPLRRPGSFGREEPMLHDEWSYFLGFCTGRVGLMAKPLAVYRRHSRNTSGTPTPRHRQRGGDEVQRYIRSANRCRDYATFLESLSAEAPERQASLLRASAFFGTFSTRWRRRADIYSASGIHRATRVAGSLPGYSPRTRGGLGFLSLAKDARSVIG
jgi:glycosyltransferase involved in cell wall biosynthesis